MKKYLLIILLLSCIKSYPQEKNYTEYQYTTLNGEKLGLDFYEGESNSKKKPTIIFVHGGAFMTGSKNSEYVLPFAQKFSESGYNVVSIDYRLTLEGKSFHCDCPSSEKIKTFEHAVNDLRSATKYLLEHSRELQIDTKKIIIAGNSAGAETVLHAAYWTNNQYNIGSQILKNSFKYAGVIAYAGAILDTSLITEDNIVPTALYHGTCDPLVPYKTAAHHFCADSTVGALHLSGSYDIMLRIKNLDESYFLYSFCHGDHATNTQAMQLQIDNTINFINETILQKKKKQENIIEQSSSEKCKFVEIGFCE